MPVLGTLLTSLFGGIVAWFTQFVTRKVAYALTALTMMSTITLALFTLMRVTLNALNNAVTGIPQMFVNAFAAALPPTAPFCVSCYSTIWTAVTAYKWQRDLISLAMKA